MATERIEYEFDGQEFIRDIRAKTPGGLASLRDMEAVCGLSASTLSRIQNGALPDMDSFLKVCAQLQLEPGSYFRRAVWRKVDSP